MNDKIKQCLSSSQKLVQTLEEVRKNWQDDKSKNLISLDVMIYRAKRGYYADFSSPLDTPIIELVKDLISIGAEDIADRAKDGEFDATMEEGNEWWKKEGKQLAEEAFGKDLSKKLFGGEK